MTKDDIIRMAEEAGAYTPERYPDEWRFDADDLERFVDLVAAAERENCAKVCEGLTAWHSELVTAAYETAADAIRARGQE
jgi:hypothetical protein